jgi:hypothetical protein
MLLGSIHNKKWVSVRILVWYLCSRNTCDWASDAVGVCVPWRASRYGIFFMVKGTLVVWSQINENLLALKLRVCGDVVGWQALVSAFNKKKICSDAVGVYVCFGLVHVLERAWGIRASETGGGWSCGVHAITSNWTLLASWKQILKSASSVWSLRIAWLINPQILN